MDADKSDAQMTKTFSYSMTDTTLTTLKLSKGKSGLTKAWAAPGFLS